MNTTQFLQRDFQSCPPQDKALHAAAPPASGPTRVQAERRDEGVAGGGLPTAHPDGAPPLSAGPQATEGPSDGAALRPEAGRGRGHPQGLCRIHEEPRERRRESGQVAQEERGGAPLRRCSWNLGRLHNEGSEQSSGGFKENTVESSKKEAMEVQDFLQFPRREAGGSFSSFSQGHKVHDSFSRRFGV